MTLRDPENRGRCTWEGEAPTEPAFALGSHGGSPSRNHASPFRDGNHVPKPRERVEPTMASLSRPAGRTTGESEVIVSVVEQTRRGPPPGASAKSIGRSSPWAPPSLTVASTSACSHGRPRASSSCSLIGTTLPRPASSGLVRRRTGPTTTGTYSCRGSRRDRSTAIGSKGRRTRAGLRFDPTKVLLDPYARGVVIPKDYDCEAARREGENAATAMKSVVVDSRV